MEQATAKQVGGTHYKGFKIEPFDIAFANRYDPLSFTILKYVSRHHLKSGKSDLDKAIHSTFYRAEMLDAHGQPAARIPVIPIETFISVNKTGPMEAEVLRSLDAWAADSIAEPNDDIAAHLASLIVHLRDMVYD